MPELKRDDITLHFEVDGSGPPLVLNAGMLSDSATWAPLVPLLSDHFTLIRPDNRSTGRTVPHDAPNSAAHMAADVLALMDHLGHDAFHIAGHSMGGLMAMEIAGLAPDRVTTATVMASGRVRMPRTAAVFDGLLAIRQAPQGEELWLRALYPWIFGQAFFADPANVNTALEAALAYPHAQTAEGMAHQIEMFRAFRPKTDVSQLGCPILVLYAGQDVLVPPEVARPTFHPIPDLTEVTVPDAGHSIVWDAPQTVAEHLLAFLAQHSG
ncbi:alpha/beta fold hydrolase [Sulfitobacter sp. TSTF-M16]|uniref:Alpha/beta fold hydrolase n=1 Tax=Sulfitobacter aestuariivivens TaxID=2766981 RepID=A0A927D9C7_9RHOB|nr:alpha/beta fold hydrolase [Sulfitobacter aestuariivivens]MBD3665131.1 alpha/beta fold hydrolase [Sulfitobacter aestuariivivens]